MNKIKKLAQEYRVLLSNVPSWVLTMFVLSIVSMNLFANKSIDLPWSWLALDCGIVFSWASFLSMDLIVKQFGARASILISLFSTFISLIISVLFFIAGSIPGVWGEAYNFASGTDIVSALDNTVKGNWYIVFGSTVAFIVASISNAISNEFVGKLCRKDNYTAFVLRTYVSTTIGQFIDNFVFSLIVSQVLFGWTLTQCVFCAITGALVELLFEALFTPVGWRICNKWKEQGVGNNYLDYKNS